MYLFREPMTKCTQGKKYLLRSEFYYVHGYFN